MKLTKDQLKRIIVEELRTLLNENFEDLPVKIQELYKAGWSDEVYAHRQTWEQTAYDALLKDENHFHANLTIFSTVDDYFEYQFGGPVTRIVMNLTHKMWDMISDETMADLLMDQWNSAVDYFENTEEGREIESYMRGLVGFAWAVASGELPESPYSSKLSEMAKSNIEGMVSAYGLYESLI